jgi:(p)ppGpp synthase/HD superfamily hydrolase
LTLSSRFDRAVNVARLLHDRQERKGTEIPYISHLLGVASIALEHGADEDVAIAALLHDASEDQGGKKTLELIHQEFGDRVARIVEECSDTDEVPKPAWRKRKKRYIAGIPNASADALLVSAADKLHNARSILMDLRTHGDAVWSRFNADKQNILWYYRGLVGAYEKTGRVSAPLLTELSVTVDEIGTRSERRDAE